MFFRVIVKKKKEEKSNFVSVFEESLFRLDMFNNNLLRNRLIIIFSLFET